jgi:hypothetical protein
MVQTGSGAHPASYQIGMGGIFPLEVKRSELEADHSATNAEVKKLYI